MPGWERMDNLNAIAATFPAVSALAAVAYAGLLVVILSGSARAWFSAKVAFPASSQGRSWAAIDSLRGLAALWVALFHFWEWPTTAFRQPLSTFEVITYGPKAVPIFVVISGFLIWGSVQRIRSLDDLRRYGINRLLRLFPAYLAVVAATLLVGGLLGHGAVPGAWPWKLALHETMMAAAFDSRVMVIPQAWSLFIELQFYLLAPVAAALLNRRKTLVLSVAVLVFYLSEFPGDLRNFGLWKFFFIGMLARELAGGPLGKLPDAVQLAVFAAGVALLVVDFRYDWVSSAFALLHLTAAPVGRHLSLGLGIAAGAMVFAAANSAWIERLFGTRPLQMLGVISYSVFLWHGVLITLDLPITFSPFGTIDQAAPIRITADFGWPLLAIAIPALVLVSTASFLLIERPFLMRRPKPVPQAAVRP